MLPKSHIYYLFVVKNFFGTIEWSDFLAIYTIISSVTLSLQLILAEFRDE